LHSRQHAINPSQNANTEVEAKVRDLASGDGAVGDLIGFEVEEM
jgi:hypothetical protein